jgi:hypothetical protein
MDFNILKILMLSVTLASCGIGHHTEADPVRSRSSDGPDKSMAVTVALDDFDLVQRTCALYIAVRSRAFEKPISFNTDLNTAPIRWNVCPEKNMVACATVSDPMGDTLQAGIPWPYGWKL